MYQILDKDTINMEIIPHLSVAQRGYTTRNELVETVNAILYKLKTGVPWEYLPVKSLFLVFPQMVQERRLAGQLGTYSFHTQKYN